MILQLHGYRYSVYLRIAAMTLIEKNVGWTHIEVDPFGETVPGSRAKSLRASADPRP